MSLFGNIFDFAKDSLGEFASHPLQTAGAAFGVPGYDPFFGGLFNNQPGGALLSPTGNFTSSAWQDMYRNHPGDAGGLNLFNGINSIADKVAPAIAGSFAGPALGSAMGGAGGGAGASAAGSGAAAADGASGIGAAGGMGGAGTAGAATWGGASAAPIAGSGTAGLFSQGAGAGGLTGLMNGPAAVGDAGLTGMVSGAGSGIGSLSGAGMGDSLGAAPTGLFSGMLPGGGMSGTGAGAMGGGISGDAAGGAPLGGSTMGGFHFGANPGSMLNQAQQMMQLGSRQPQQQMMMMPGAQNRFGGQRNPQMPVGPSMSYARFGAPGGAPVTPFGFGGSV